MESVFLSVFGVFMFLVTALFNYNVSLAIQGYVKTILEKGNVGKPWSTIISVLSLYIPWFFLIDIESLLFFKGVHIWLG